MARRTLDAGLKRLEGRFDDNYFLFGTYTLFVSGCVLMASQEIAHYLFLLVVLPLAFRKAAQLYALRSPSEVSGGLCPSRAQIAGTTIPVTLCAAVIYLLALILSSALQKRTIAIEELVPLFIVTFEIIAFLLVTALLVVSQKGFLNGCLAALAIVAAANALVAIIVFIASTPFNQLSYDRLGDAAWAPGERLGVASLVINSGILLVASVAVLLEGIRSVWIRTLLTSSALILACALILSQSRSVLLAAAAGLAVSCRWSWRLITAAAITLALLTLIFINVPSVHDAALRRGDSRRFEIWRHYVESVLNQPWLGSGMIEKIGFESKDGLVIAHPHNLILSAAVKGGVFAAAAMIIILVGGLYYSARYAQMTGQRAPLGIITTLLVAGLFDYDLVIGSFPSWQVIPFWFPIGICIGTELYVSSRRNNDHSRIRSQRV